MASDQNKQSAGAIAIEVLVWAALLVLVLTIVLSPWLPQSVIAAVLGTFIYILFAFFAFVAIVFAMGCGRW